MIEKIKFYVYLYSDPDTKEVFYIGKGRGNRCFDHLDDDTESPKTKRIQEIRRRGKKPIIELLRYELTEKEAALIEACLIDYSGIDNLTNKMRGAGSKSSGRILVDDIIVSETAHDVGGVDDDVILIIINKRYRSNMSADELYEATKGMWVAGRRREKAKYAFAVFKGIVREIYEIQQWYPAGTLPYHYRDVNESLNRHKNKNRWEFEGRKADENIRQKYLQQSVRCYLPKGHQSPIKYINCR